MPRLDALLKTRACAMKAKESIFRAQDAALHIEDDATQRRIERMLLNVRNELEALDRVVDDYRDAERG